VRQRLPNGDLHVQYRTSCRRSTSAIKRRWTQNPRARIRYADSCWMNRGIAHLNFPHVPYPLSPVTLNNSVFADPILAPGTCGVEARRGWRPNPEPITPRSTDHNLGVYSCGFPFHRSGVRNWPRRFLRTLFWRGKRVSSVLGCIF
jgi:hypothetical protein